MSLFFYAEEYIVMKKIKKLVKETKEMVNIDFHVDDLPIKVLKTEEDSQTPFADIKISDRMFTPNYQHKNIGRFLHSMDVFVGFKLNEYDIGDKFCLSYGEKKLYSFELTEKNHNDLFSPSAYDDKPFYMIVCSWKDLILTCENRDLDKPVIIFYFDIKCSSDRMVLSHCEECREVNESSFKRFFKKTILRK